MERVFVQTAGKGSKALAVLISVAAAARICLALLYRPGEAPDSTLYRRLAEQIRAFDFKDYDGARTPV